MLFALFFTLRSSRWRRLFFSARLFLPRSFSRSRDVVVPLVFVLALSLVTLVDCMSYFWGAVGLDFPYQWVEKKYYQSQVENTNNALYGGVLSALGGIQIVWLVVIIVECGLTGVAAVGALVSYTLGLVVSLLHILGLLPESYSTSPSKPLKSDVEHKKNDDIAQEHSDETEAEDLHVPEEALLTKIETVVADSTVRYRGQPSEPVLHNPISNTVIAEISTEATDERADTEAEDAQKNNTSQSADKEASKSVDLQELESNNIEITTAPVDIVQNGTFTNTHQQCENKSELSKRDEDQKALEDTSRATYPQTAEPPSEEEPSPCHTPSHLPTLNTGSLSPDINTGSLSPAMSTGSAGVRAAPRSAIPQRSGIPRLKTSSPR